jgi:prolipoprotein diacylglyceryltransferase/tetratricopeptide (TPR) repeat protein
MTGPALHYVLWTLGTAAGFVAAVAVLYVRRALGIRTLLALCIAVAGLAVGANLQFRFEVFPLREALDVHRSPFFLGSMRIPLGLLLGAVLAGIWCVIVRAPWRETGDALAVAASVMIPIGRIGCLKNGCCMGTVCGRWVSGLWCLRYPSGTQAYEQQLRDGLISLSDPLSFPAHPLPVYFALASLATLWILLRMLWRNAPPGRLLAVFCILRPLTKLLLEPLRAMPRQGDLMVAIPLGVLLVTCTVLAVGSARRSFHAHRALGTRAAALLLLACVAWFPKVLRADVAPPVPDAGTASWAELLARYARDPSANYGELRAFAARTRGDLPVPVVLALADGHLRMGRTRAAANVLESLSVKGLTEPWAGWVELELGWVCLVRRDLPSAAVHFRHVAAADGSSSILAQLVVALIEAGERQYAEADRDFEAVASTSAADPRLRDAARLGAAYNKYWAGQFREAEVAFTRVSPDGRFSDDARYGAAVALWRMGEREESLTALRRLVHYGNPERLPETFPERLLKLDWRAIVRTGLARYRQAPIGPPDAVAASILDGDGIALARAALHRWNSEDTRFPRVERVPVETATPVLVPGELPPDRCPYDNPKVVARLAAESQRGGDEGGGWPRWRVGLALAAASLLLTWTVMARRRGKVRQRDAVRASAMGATPGRAPRSAGVR